MNAAQLKAIADALATKASQALTVAGSEAGQWARVVAAAEALSATTSSANPNVAGLMLRTAKALEAVSGTSPVGKSDTYDGLMQRIVDALEVKAGAVTQGSLYGRAVAGASAFNNYHLSADFKRGQYQQVRTRTNLLLRSQDFTDGYWSGGGPTGLSANAGIAPDGTTTATSWAGTGRLFQEYNGINATYTGSVWVKTLTGTPNITLVVKDRQSDTVRGSATVVSPLAWTRISATGLTAGAAVGFRNEIAITGGTILIWGAQVEAAPQASAYIPTTSAAVSVTETVNPGPMRMNMWFQSNTLANAATALTVTTSAVASPVAGTLVENVVPTAVSTVHAVARTSIVPAAGKIVVSIYAKANGYSKIGIGPNNNAGTIGGGSFDLAAGTAISTTNSDKVSITSLGNGWYRCACQFQVGGAAGATILLLDPTGTTPTFTGDGTSGVLFTAPQVEYLGQADLAVMVPPSDYLENTSANTAVAGGIADFYGFAYSRTGNKGEVRANPFAYGPELVSNGDFSNGLTGWTVFSGSGAASGGVAVLTNTAAAECNLQLAGFSCTPGTMYEITYTRTANNATAGGLYLGGVSASLLAGTNTLRLRAVNTAAISFGVGSANVGASVSIDNISIREALQYSLGAELVTNGGFDSDTAWTKGSGVTISGGVASTTGTSAYGTIVQQATTLQAGKTYKCAITVNKTSGNSVAFQYGAANIVSGINGSGVSRVYFTPTLSNQALSVIEGNGATWVGSIDNISVREVIPQVITYAPANVPAIVSGDGYWSRPAFTNLLLQSQTMEVTGPAWALGSVTVTPNQITAPDGSMTADLIDMTATLEAHYQTITVAASTTYTYSVWLKRGTATDLKMSVRDSTNNTDILSATSIYAQLSATQWVRYTYTFTTPATCTAISIYTSRDTGVTGTYYAWQAQLVQGSDPGPIIVTTSAAATVGADDLRVPAPVTNADDFLFVVVANLSSGPNKPIGYLGDLGVNNRILISTNGSGNPVVNIKAGGVDQGNPTGGVVLTTGRTVFLVRVKASKVTFGYKIPSGAVTLLAESSTITIPAITTFAPADPIFSGRTNDPIEFVGIRKGTFSDADVTAILGAL